MNLTKELGLSIVGAAIIIGAYTMTKSGSEVKEPMPHSRVQMQAFDLESKFDKEIKSLRESGIFYRRRIVTNDFKIAESGDKLSDGYFSSDLGKKIISNGSFQGLRDVYDAMAILPKNRDIQIGRKYPVLGFEKFNTYE